MKDLNCNDCLTDTEFDTSKPQTCWRNQKRSKPKQRKCSVKRLSNKVLKQVGTIELHQFHNKVIPVYTQQQ